MKASLELKPLLPSTTTTSRTVQPEAGLGDDSYASVSLQSKSSDKARGDNLPYRSVLF